MKRAADLSTLKSALASHRLQESVASHAIAIFSNKGNGIGKIFSVACMVLVTATAVSAEPCKTTALPLEPPSGAQLSQSPQCGPYHDDGNGHMCRICYGYAWGSSTYCYPK
jgi:hypothetical protein